MLIGRNTITINFIKISIFLLAILPLLVNAAGFKILNAVTHLDGNIYFLDAKISYRFSKHALDALENGVPLTVEMSVEVRRKRWLLNKTIKTLKKRFRLEYQVISRNYLIINLTNGEISSFPTRDRALKAIEEITNFPVIDKLLLADNEIYHCALRVILDTELLPAPLRLFTYISSDWQLNSEWYICSL